MLYSNLAKFHISIIPVRWYKDSILTNLDINLKNSPILTAIETTTDTSTLSQITSFKVYIVFKGLIIMKLFVKILINEIDLG